MAAIGVVGTGAWGTTLAIITARRGHQVRLLARTEAEARTLSDDGEQSRFLPGVPFPDGLRVTSSARDALGDADLVIIATPSRAFRQNASGVSAHISERAIVVSATKGIEIASGKRMSQVLEDELPEALRPGVCVLSGPNLAREIVEERPASTVIASRNADAARAAQDIVNSPRFRVYTNDDVVGVEFGGALKNIIALGAGVCEGLGLGDNAKAGFITRGLAEIARLSVAAGANPLTLSGLAGMGDLIATCASPLSRNHQFGVQLSKGRTLEQIRASMTSVAEGVDTTAATVPLAARMGVEMPIAQATHRVLFEGANVTEVIAGLLERAPRPELTGLEA